ncbi:MAG: hypothetical protein QG608_786 [Actinomycetota bacterium]|jgi:WXG100 family type VII secretion target|nr:hypothetical protein [Actinomycetota bacterium]
MAYSITYSAVQDLAMTLNKQTTDLNGIVTQMLGTASRLFTQWEGQSQAAYTQAQKAWSSQAQVMSTDMNTNIARLNTIVQNYQDADARAARG